MAAARVAVARPWRVFALLGVVQFLVVLDGSVVVIAMPSIQRDLGLTPANLSWVLNAYLLAFGGLLLAGGRAADIVGRRRLVLLGTSLFVVASLACGVSQAGWQLVAGRVAQGVAAAFATPAALALVTDVFPEGHQRNRALAIWGGMGGIAGAAGIVFGGLLSAVAWQLVFLVNVPIGLVVLIGARMIPVVRHERPATMDLFGAVVATSGLSLLIFGVVHGGSSGWLSTATLVGFGAAVVLLAVFVVHQRRTGDPLVPRALLRLPNVVIGNAVNALLGALLFAGFLASTLFMQEVRDYNPGLAALLIVPMNLTMLVGSQAAPHLIGRFGPARALLVGLGVQAAALMWWAPAVAANGNVALSSVVPGSLWCVGLGITIVAAYVLCTSGVTGQAAGVASGLVTTTFEVGGAVGVALLATVVDHRVAAAVAEGVERVAAVVAGLSSGLWAAAVVAVLAAPPLVYLHRRSA